MQLFSSALRLLLPGAPQPHAVQSLQESVFFGLGIMWATKNATLFPESVVLVRRAGLVELAIAPHVDERKPAQKLWAMKVGISSEVCGGGEHPEHRAIFWRLD